MLLIEDDARLAQLVAEFLTARGMLVEVAGDGAVGLELSLRRRFDVLLLDLMLPGLDGLEVCRRLRARSDVPIVMVTASDAEGQRILGLEIGADDYLCKPFSTPELYARVCAIVRRHRGLLARRSEPLRVGALALDPAARTATFDGAQLTLTMFEFDLLLCFAQNEGTVLERERILELVHGSADTAFDRSIDGHISRLRRKLGDAPRHPTILKTVRGKGYLFVVPPARDGGKRT